MKLTDILDKDHIVADLQARSKRGVMEELCRVMAKSNPKLDQSRLMEVLIERERLGSTGIGDGIAIPHGKTDQVDTLQLAFGRSVAGVDFDSLDAKPAHLFFLVVAPENSAGLHLKALARISRLLKSTAVRRELMQAADAIEIYEVVASQDDDF